MDYLELVSIYVCIKWKNSREKTFVNWWKNGI